MSRRILITGASVAGNTVAWWLGRAGLDVTVVERSPGFRDGGQNIDVRGVGREVLRRMGLERTALEQGTGERGTAWVEEDGTVAASFLTDDTGADGPTAEMEILRGDLARLLYEPAREQAVYRFGDSIAGIAQDDDGATVTFASGTVERYDLVIVAEGVGSRTRELVFPGENELFHHSPTGRRRSVVALVQRARRPERVAPPRPARHRARDVVRPAAAGRRAGLAHRPSEGLAVRALR